MLLAYVYLSSSHKKCIQTPYEDATKRLGSNFQINIYNWRRTPSSESCIMYSLTACAVLFLFGWPPCQRSDMTLMEVSQRALDSLYIRSIWLLNIGGVFLFVCLGFFVCYLVVFLFFFFFWGGGVVTLIWYLYLFWLNKHCLSLSLILLSVAANTHQ